MVVYHQYRMKLESGKEVVTMAKNIMDAISNLAENGIIHWYDEVIAVETIG